MILPESLGDIDVVSIEDKIDDTEREAVENFDEEILSENVAVTLTLLVVEMEDDSETESLSEELELIIAELVGVALLYKLPLTLDDTLGLIDELEEELSCTEFDRIPLTEVTILSVGSFDRVANEEDETDCDKLCKAEGDTLKKTLGLTEELPDALS